MTEQKKQQIHDTLYKYCREFLQAQEITHAANDVAGKSDFCGHSQVLYAFILMLSIDFQHEMYMLLINE